MLYSGGYHQLIPCLQPDFCLAVHKNSFGALFASRSLLSCLYHPTSYPDFPHPPPESSLASICETVSETHKIQLGSHSVGWLPCLHCKVALVLSQDPPSLFPKPHIQPFHPDRSVPSLQTWTSKHILYIIVVPSVPDFISPKPFPTSRLQPTLHLVYF